jgi:hypothetical protein
MSSPTYSPTHLLTYTTMPAKICVESGISAGTRFWIDRPVLRIGSDPQCEICLPSADLAPHALTLEFRDGTYRAYNRCSAPVNIGRAAVQPGTNAAWNSDQTVRLPGDLRLVLEIDGDPRPSPRPEARSEDDGFAADDAAPKLLEPMAAADATKKKSSGTMVQLAVIGLCVLGMAAMLTMRGGADTASAANRPSFASIVRATLAEEDDDVTRALLPRLQYAQAALVRGNGQLARRQFLRLRDQLVRQREALPDAEREGVERMLQYVEYQLSRRQ